MSTIASLNVLLGLDTARFASGGKKATTTLSRIEARLNTFSNLARGAMGLLAGGMIFDSFRKSMESIDATGKMADRLGTTTEALIGLQHAGDIAGLGAQTVSKGMEMMTRNLGNAVVKGDETSKVLAQFGLDAGKLAAMKPDQAFMEIADAISQIQNPAQQAALAVAVFGRSGMDLLNVLSIGRGGLEAMRADVEALGSSFSRLDAANVEKANDAIGRMVKALGALKITAAKQLAPYLTGLADFITKNKDAITTTVAWTAGLGAAAFALKKIVTVSVTVVSAIKAIAKAQTLALALTGPKGWAIIAGGLVAAAAAAVMVDKAFDGVSQSIREANAEAEKAANMVPAEPAAAITASGQFGGTALLQAANDAAQEQIDKLRQQVQFFGASEDQILAWELAQRGATDAQIDSVRAWAGQLKAMENVKREQDALIQASIRWADAIATPLEKFGEAFEEIQKLVNAGLMSNEEAQRAADVAIQQSGLKQQFDAQQRRLMEQADEAERKRLASWRKSIEAPQTVGANERRFVEGMGNAVTPQKDKHLDKIAKNSEKQLKEQQKLRQQLENRALFGTQMNVAEISV